MAVAKMKKLSVVALQKDTEQLIAELQKLRCVEVTAAAQDALPAADISGEVSTLASQLAGTRRAIAFLTAYDNGKHSLFAPPMEASIDDFDSGLDAIALEEVEAANALSVKIAETQTAQARIEAELGAYRPWIGQETALPEDRTAHTRTLAGTLPMNADAETIDGRLLELACVTREVYADKTTRGVLLTAHNDDYDAARKILISAGFAPCPVQAGERDGYAAGAAEQCLQRLEACRAELKEQKRAATEMAEKQLSDFKALHDVLETRQERIRAKGCAGQTACTAVMYGWVPARAEEKVTALLERYDAAYSFAEPEADDDVPVLLHNRQPTASYESILSMYALPVYGRFDPTAIMAVFYTIIFGLMFADVGYGAILLLGCLFALRFLHLNEGTKRFVSVFAICGVSCIVGGILFGGYFGDLPNALRENFGGKETRQLALWFDMIEEPIMMLVLSLAVGVVHMVTAFIIKFVILVRDGQVFDAIADVGSWLVLFAGIGICFLQSTAGFIVAGIGALMLICTQGRQEKNIFMKFAKGVMSLYDIVGYASDLLSYSRILALSLASAVIASVMNLLSTMGGVSVGGIILFVVVFLLGHVINFAVNILGTYVHTSRLQYIEFFGKFYESGGRAFAPLEPQSKYVQFK